MKLTIETTWFFVLVVLCMGLSNIAHAMKADNDIGFVCGMVMLIFVAAGFALGLKVPKQDRR